MGAVITVEGPLGDSLADPLVKAEVEATIIDLVKKAAGEPVWLELLVAMTLAAHGEEAVVEQLIGPANLVAAWEFVLQRASSDSRRTWAIRKLEAVRLELRRVMLDLEDQAKPVRDLIEKGSLVSDHFLDIEVRPPLLSHTVVQTMTWVKPGNLFASYDVW